MPRERLSPAEARRLAIAAQGLAGGSAPRTSAGDLGPAAVTALARRLRLVQIDSVNVLARAHHLTLLARLGAHRAEGVRATGLHEDVGAALARAAGPGARRSLFEYWGHEASFVPVEDHALWRWRMEDARAGVGIYARLARFARERREVIERTLGEIERRGALTARDLRSLDAGARRGEGGWWGWSEAKHALEWLFWAGLVTSAGRNASFERFYDLPDRALPAAAVETRAPTRREAQARLLANALRAFGVATLHDLADHPRITLGEARAAMEDVEAQGMARRVRVRGWPDPTWMDTSARVPSRVEGRALLCPFDSLVWFRPRAERLFGMRIKLEIYTPAAERVHGYYVLPFLLGDALVARVDLKADRARGCLVVRAAHLADAARGPGEVAHELARGLRRMAATLGLERIVVEDRGDLAARLAGEIVPVRSVR